MRRTKEFASKQRRRTKKREIERRNMAKEKALTQNEIIKK